MSSRTPYRTRYFRLCIALATMSLLSLRVTAEVPGDLKIALPDAKHPYLACTADELQRLRDAYRSEGTPQQIVATYVKDAEQFVNDPVHFPPRGGQHGQWYQCDRCETALRTIDATHHQCPQCEKVYSGHPYDDVIFSRQHGRNLSQMRKAAWAYAISGRDEFARYAAKVLLGYADRYRSYPYHTASLETTSSWGRKAGGHLYEQTLTEASALATSIGPAYDLIYDSGVLSKHDHQKIVEGLLRPMLENIGRNKAGKSNWQTWHNAAMIWGGALIGEPAWVHRAIADEENGFCHQMDISVSREGMWYENSWGYHFYTLKALVDMAETTRRLGIDLWSDERLKRMFTLPIDYTMADGRLPRFGDDVNSSVQRQASLFEPAYHAYRDPQMLALLPDRPSFDSLLLGRSMDKRADLSPLESKVFEDAGHAILRMPRPAGLTAAMTFGPYGGFHGHYDKLSFVFYGIGRELGVDPGRAASQAYRLPIHTNWYKATISHNTVLVDGQSQAPASGRLTLFENADDYVAAGARCDAAYPGVKHHRLLLMTQSYLLVVDRLHADQERRFDWLYHNRGSKAVCQAATEPIEETLDWSGGEYIQSTLRGTTDETVRIVFNDAEVATHLTMAPWQSTNVLVGDGVGASVSDRVPMAMIGREGRQVNYAAVVEPVRSGSRAAVSAVSLREDNDTLTVTVERGVSQDQIRITSDATLTVALSK